MNLDEKLARILVYFGNGAQYVKTIEELSELTQILSRVVLYGRQDGDIVFSLCEEIADVEIMLKQMRMILADDERIDKIKVEKINRTYERIESGFYHD